MGDGGVQGWLGEPRAGRGLRTLSDDGWHLTPYVDIAARAAAVTDDLRERGIGAGDVVAIHGEDPVAFVCAFYGVQRAGATVVVLPVDDAPGRARAAGACAALGGGVPLEALTPRRLAGLAPAVLQFTSGTTAEPRPVRITRANLDANVAAIRRWLDWRDEDVGALCLPFHHDMGLVGLLTACAAQSDIWQLTPRQFLASPDLWLACLGRHGASVTAAPTFAYAYAARRSRPEQLAQLDFTRWRHAIVGAERVDAAALDALTERLRPYGFRASTFRPAYGMAEATLAVTGVPAGAVARRVSAPGGLRLGGLASVHDAADDPTALVSCGVPLEGVELSIRDEDARPLPPATLGEIHVAGASIADGCAREGGTFATGDAGFVLDGELFVVGRMASSVKVRGRHVACETLEAAARAVLGAQTSCVVVPGPLGRPSAVTVVLEAEPAARADAVLRAVRRHLGPTVAATIAVRAIPRTSSGKPRRTALWRAVHDVDPQPASSA